MDKAPRKKPTPLQTAGRIMAMLHDLPDDATRKRVLTWVTDEIGMPMGPLFQGCNAPPLSPPKVHADGQENPPF
jgi:hypothetical protein